MSTDAIRHGYVQHGVEGYYTRFGARYRNPHESAIVEAVAAAHRRSALPLDAVLDLACGSGEATRAVSALGASAVTGVDPYTGAAYAGRTGRAAIELDFAQIAAGALDGRRFSLIVCSFALHLCDASRLPGVTWALAGLAETMLVLSPHKRPPIELGWTLVDAFVHQRAAHPEAAGGPRRARTGTSTRVRVRRFDSARLTG